MKIVSAVNAMVSKPEQITDVSPGGQRELFFLYAGKHKWSIRKDKDDDIQLWFYPGAQSLKELAGYQGYDWQDYAEMVYYSSNDIGTREAKESFEELLRTVKEKQFGVDKILDEIIGDSDWA